MKKWDHVPAPGSALKESKDIVTSAHCPDFSRKMPFMGTLKTISKKCSAYKDYRKLVLSFAKTWDQ